VDLTVDDTEDAVAAGHRCVHVGGESRVGRAEAVGTVHEAWYRCFPSPPTRRRRARAAWPRCSRRRPSVRESRAARR
jgi:hypothetical protein